VYATIDGNTAGTGANILTLGTLTSFGSVVAQPLGGGANCSTLDVTVSHGYNDEDDAGASCGFSTGKDDLAPGTSADLGPLGSNGGPTETMVPNVGSPLINAIPNGSCESDGAAGITADQRGFPRPSPVGGVCDVGAVEVQFPTLAASASVSQWQVLNQLISFGATISAAGQDVAGRLVTFTVNGPYAGSCTATTNTNGVATTCAVVVRPGFLIYSIHSFTAVYAGSVNYEPGNTTGSIHP